MYQLHYSGMQGSPRAVELWKHLEDLLSEIPGDWRDGAGQRLKALAALSKTRVQFPAPTLYDLQLPVTPALGD